MLQMCEVSQDLKRFRTVAFVLGTDQDNLQSLMPFKHMLFLILLLRWPSEGGSLLCYVDTAETLAFRDSGKCTFLLINTDLSSIGRRVYIPHQPLVCFT